MGFLLKHFSYRLSYSHSRSLPYYVQGNAGAPVNDHSSGPGAPDLELLWVPQAVFGDGFPKPDAKTDGVTFAAVALKPESRGRIMLRSNSVWDEPVIDPKYASVFILYSCFTLLKDFKSYASM